ncbi:hypothetical protein LPC08_11245 [Roseomonas sp. OT10]|uniref:hypothetical protein n=1 Tax=Roseomonas cutis TaxID=2897332 RepID=UPI001E5ADA23|nr:hypothetical protein [Roseomonas sp. OT10]UFN51132.1 hypothetical protein LPC08_11245 [Roseomonas sp. OT10]
MSRDPLAVLDRLQRLHLDQARQSLGEALGRLQAAELRHAVAEAALVSEGMAEPPGDYAAWLPAGLAQRDAALAGQQRAAARAEAAREALAGARAAHRAVERLRDLRAAATARRAGRAAQAALDETARRRPG